jgi:hypothetical protein
LDELRQAVTATHASKLGALEEKYTELVGLIDEVKAAINETVKLKVSDLRSETVSKDGL